MTENEVSKLFFKYEKGDFKKYSEEYLINACFYLTGYTKILKKHYKKFLIMMEELPKYIFDYYLRIMESYPDFSKIILKISREKINEPRNVNPVIEKLEKNILRKKTVYSVDYINENTLIISLNKKHKKYMNISDCLITFKEKEIKKFDLMNEYKKTFELQEDEVYKRNLKEFNFDIKEFKEKNKLQILCN